MGRRRVAKTVHGVNYLRQAETFHVAAAVLLFLLLLLKALLLLVGEHPHFFGDRVHNLRPGLHADDEVNCTHEEQISLTPLPLCDLFEVHA